MASTSARTRTRPIPSVPTTVRVLGTRTRTKKRAKWPRRASFVARRCGRRSAWPRSRLSIAAEVVRSCPILGGFVQEHGVSLLQRNGADSASVKTAPTNPVGAAATNAFEHALVRRTAFASDVAQQRLLALRFRPHVIDSASGRAGHSATRGRVCLARIFVALAVLGPCGGRPPRRARPTAATHDSQK